MNFHQDSTFLNFVKIAKNQQILDFPLSKIKDPNTID